MDGGDALNGVCDVALLRPGTYANGAIIVSATNSAYDSPVDACPDLDYTGTGGGGTDMTDYLLDPLVIPCLDSNGDGLLE